MVDLGSAFGNRAIDRAALARPQQDDVAGVDGSHRHLRNLIGSDELGSGFGFQRREISGNRPRSPPHALIEIASNKQKSKQHDRRIEIGVLGMIDRLHDRHTQRQQNADADRDVHIDVARAQRPIRRPEERLPRIGRSRQRDQCRQPVKKVALFGEHIAAVAGPYRNGKHHDVHRGERRNPEAAQQKARLLNLSGLRVGGLERVGLVSELGEPVDEVGGVERALFPFQRDAAVGEIDARQRDVRHRRKPALDLGHASGAIDALNRQINVLKA
ncbi:hypothetical protein GALL_520380 [mine drainage metagenome]|uniref:Uncharacterized protein n=1 Tax=mine drainage metagenome TaxID=410659 RepID=A0A1J5P4A9_9ZZZZ